MTAQHDAQSSQTAQLEPTEYFHFDQLTGGDPRHYVVADHDEPMSRERYMEEVRAYRAIDGVEPRELDPVHLPKNITLRKKRKVPSVFLSERFVVVDGAVRSAIEALEPDRHQFIPIKVFHQNGEEEPREFFFLNVHHVVDVMALDEMGVKIKTSLDGESFYMLPTSYVVNVKVRRAALEGAGHLFTDPRCQFPSSAWFISKEMVAAIKAAKGRLCELYPCEVVD